MSMNQEYAIGPGWESLIAGVGVDPADVLRKACLPDDLLKRDNAKVSGEAMFRFCAAFDESIADPRFWVQLTDAMSPELFTPPVFASLCSPDMATAARRLSFFKPLICPLILEVEEGPELRMTYRWKTLAVPPPSCMHAMEAMFAVKMARLGTREPIVPLSVVMPTPPADSSALDEYLGVPVQRGEVLRVTFSERDANARFLTSSGAMWQIFEPRLRQRLADLEGDATYQERTRAILLEGLPSGEFAVDVVARRLAVSPRTLQRRLREEGTSFKDVVGETRESLARHYLRRSELGFAEIAYLLGFEEPNSFFRAFHRWTGTTPERMREQLAAG
ncbi:MAG: AraC family transcriptional regulator [Deltaproteobacteria bacterium]|nr:AraC family transcriptional regulator [Deltaproteobacteria bacterium]